MTISHRFLIGSILLLERRVVCGVKPHVLRYWEQSSQNSTRQAPRKPPLLSISRPDNDPRIVHWCISRDLRLWSKLRIQEEDRLVLPQLRMTRREWLCARSSRSQQVRRLLSDCRCILCRTRGVAQPGAHLHGVQHRRFKSCRPDQVGIE